MPSRARWTLSSLHLTCLAVAFLLFSTFLVAQGTGGRILGRVADPSGASFWVE